MKATRLNRGFTLIELLVVIGILAILLTITLIAINPARQFAQSNNTRRRSDINAMLNAIHQFSVDNRGNINALNIPNDDGDPLTPDALIRSDDSDPATTEVDLCASVVPTYISALPVDPQTGFSTDASDAVNNGTPVSLCAKPYNTNYSVVKSALTTNIRITVAAPGAELNEVISVTR